MFALLDCAMRYAVNGLPRSVVYSHMRLHMIDTTRGEVFTLIAQHLLVMVPQIDFCDACYSIGVGVCGLCARLYQE